MAGCFVFSHFLIFSPNISRELFDLFVLSFVQYLLACVVFNIFFYIFFIFNKSSNGNLIHYLQFFNEVIKFTLFVFFKPQNFNK